jgi:GTP cyclohydrolase I
MGKTFTIRGGKRVEESAAREFPRVNSLGYPVFDANASMPLSGDERAEILMLVEKKLEEVLDVMRIDRNDQNSANTPRRVARMWVNELFAGRFEQAPPVTVFPNRKDVDELVISKGIKVMSVCSHHWQPISGECSIGYLPDKHVIGLSKLSRIVDWFARRGQIQEELGEQIADYLQELIEPKALGVVISSKHYCMIARGVNADESRADMITSVMRGALRENLNLRNEFLKLIGR